MEPKVDNHIFPNLHLEWHFFFTFFLQTFQLNLMACIQESLEHLQKSLHKIVALSGKNLMLARQPNPKSKHAYWKKYILCILEAYLPTYITFLCNNF